MISSKYHNNNFITKLNYRLKEYMKKKEENKLVINHTQ
jgi:hypothetical protein